MKNPNPKYISDLQKTISTIGTYTFLEKPKDIDLNDRLHSHFVGVLGKIDYKTLSNEEFDKVDRMANQRLDLIGYERVLCNC